MSLSPPGAETFIILVFPVMLIVALLLVPLCRNRGERAPSRRPVAVLAVDRDLHACWAILTYEGVTAPWSPEMTAWSGDPVPDRCRETQPPTELMGAVRVSEQELPQLPCAGRESAAGAGPI